MKKILITLTIAGMLAVGCSTNKKNDAADADSNRIDTTMTNQSSNGIADTTSSSNDTNLIDTSSKM